MLQQPREKSKTSGLAAFLRCILTALKKKSNLNADHGPAIKLTSSPSHAALPSLVVRMHNSDILGKAGDFRSKCGHLRLEEKSKESSLSFLCIGYSIGVLLAPVMIERYDLITTPGFSSMIHFWCD